MGTIHRVARSSKLLVELPKCPIKISPSDSRLIRFETKKLSRELTAFDFLFNCFVKMQSKYFIGKRTSVICLVYYGLKSRKFLLPRLKIAWKECHSKLIGLYSKVALFTLEQNLVICVITNHLFILTFKSKFMENLH